MADHERSLMWGEAMQDLPGGSEGSPLPTLCQLTVDVTTAVHSRGLHCTPQKGPGVRYLT